MNILVNILMLLTYDAGRPHEIDTETLNVVTPVGYRAEWQALFKSINFPFNSILSTAHPNFDYHTGEMFTVNYGRSLNNFLDVKANYPFGISQDYVILMDTSFMVGIEQIFNQPLPWEEILEQFREQVKTVPSFNSSLYIVPRKNLKEGLEVVVAYKVVIPLESCHFLVDYENPDQKITLHVSHICAWDVAEWIRPYDRSASMGD